MLSDLWILRLDDLEWCSVDIKSDSKVEPRYNHTAVQFGSKLIIFGGMNENMTLEMSAQEFELDEDVVETKIKREEKERERERIALEAARRKKQQSQ